MPGEGKACACPIDWVLCFSKNCPRAARIRSAQRAQIEATRRFLGDPSISIGGTALPQIQLSKDLTHAR